MINYDLRKIRCIAFDVDGVLSAQTIALAADGEPLRTVNIKDGYAIQLAMKSGLRIAVITGGNTRAVRIRYEGLGVQDIFMGSAVKLKAYEALLAEHHLTDEEVMFMGDDIPDLEVMRRVGCPVCPSDACQEVREASIYVSSLPGGHGCARDIIEQVLRAQGLWLRDATAFGW